MTKAELDKVERRFLRYRKEFYRAMCNALANDVPPQMVIVGAITWWSKACTEAGVPTKNIRDILFRAVDMTLKNLHGVPFPKKVPKDLRQFGVK